MIAVFPTIYPDELLYSQLARFYARSGYPGYTFAAEDLFENKTVRPDIEFLNAYTPEALHLITHEKPIEGLYWSIPCFRTTPDSLGMNAE